MALDLTDRRVLITGGAGFIGSNLANHLAEQNEVIVVDNESLGTASNLDDSVEHHQVSVVDSELPTDVDVLYHLAAQSSYPMHEENPQNGARVNIEGFVNTVEQARQDGCGTVVYASTSSIYGDCREPTREDVQVSARTGYEASKLAREQYADYFESHYGMSLAGMRFFSVYQGYGGAEGHKGEYANIISQFADKISRGESPVIYGDGTQTRDFTHVDDVVRGLELAGSHGLSGRYNLGTGKPYSFNTVVERLCDVLGRDVTPEYVENPIPADVYVHDTCADWSRMHEATGWQPKIGFAEGIRRVCDPYVDQSLIDSDVPT